MVTIKKKTVASKMHCSIPKSRRKNDYVEQHYLSYLTSDLMLMKGSEETQHVMIPVTRVRSLLSGFKIRILVQSLLNNKNYQSSIKLYPF